MSFASTQKHDATNDSLEMESYPVLEAGIYRAKLETIASLDTKFGEALQFTWRVIGGENDGDTFNALANKKLMPKSKLALWAKAHLGIATFPDNFVLKLSSLIGKEVHITLSVEPRTDGSGDRNTVQAVSPYKPATKKPKPAAKPAENGFTDAFEEEIPDPGEPLRAKSNVWKPEHHTERRLAMAIPLHDLHAIALVSMKECPQGLERKWLTIVLKAMAATFRRQCQPQPDDDAAHLDTLFCCLVDQWNSIRAIALTRGVSLDPAERAEQTVDEFRALFFEADALNALLPADAV